MHIYAQQMYNTTTASTLSTEMCCCESVNLTPDLAVSLTVLMEVQHWLTHLFDLQPVAPDPLQQVTQAGDERILFQTSDIGLTVAQFHCLSAHLFYQHPLGLQNTSKKNQLQPHRTELEQKLLLGLDCMTVLFSTLTSGVVFFHTRFFFFSLNFPKSN